MHRARPPFLPYAVACVAFCSKKFEPWVSCGRTARVSLPDSGGKPALPALDPLEQQVVDVFIDGVRVLGLPRSIGEIYGLLFVSREALSLDDLVRRLGISKGSASQGLRALKALGAVREAPPAADRRTYYEPAVELKRLAGGFIREQVRPHLDSGKSKIDRLARRAREIEDPHHREFLGDRIDRLNQWMRRGSQVLPILQKLLAS
jgi:HTH-type transcriptional regulator, glycine betaine synthesis regulator